MSTIHQAITGMIIVCSLTLWGCSKDKTAVEQEVPFVMVSQPSGSHTEQKSYAGDVQAKQQTALAFRVPGQITQRLVDVGDRVSKGQVLAILDVKDALLQSNVARAQLDNAKSAAKIAQDELHRFQQLLPLNAVSRSQYDAVENQYKAAASTLKQAQANFEVSQNQTSYNKLIATQNGVITGRHIEVGQVVAAGQAAFDFAVNGDREVVIGVPEQAVSEFKVGQSAWVTLWSKPNEKFAGYIREISPAADQSRTFRIKVALREGHSLIQLGQSARVFFVSNRTDILTVPLSSVSAENGQAYVMTVKPDNTLRKVPVTLGAYGRDSVPVLSGLKADEYVVIGGIHLLRDKQTIRPIDRENRSVKIQAGG
ncbi:efflux transporter periplasmic adaptor subunit [Acinetobacter sp. NCu2D-2]|uniref:efflux RND transporter periplasmic adaptor subunit n=1 Tax=Acinetobacter sp. NCu2D-2 TaxID=1608473 RepID=UPI0007CDDD45|nr:efflux RND transporter periplasmic adaptor subunit [Acinetobacter sp. NCu2D-2]ANF82925.1 efflux transporter periplasmic adaptor subunit [Acinetobacter sp. NCu2D-2]